MPRQKEVRWKQHLSVESWWMGRNNLMMIMVMVSHPCSFIAAKKNFNSTTISETHTHTQPNTHVYMLQIKDIFKLPCFCLCNCCRSLLELCLARLTVLTKDWLSVAGLSLSNIIIVIMIITTKMMMMMKIQMYKIRVAKCQIFYTDKNLSSKFYPKNA